MQPAAAEVVAAEAADGSGGVADDECGSEPDISSEVGEPTDAANADSAFKIGDDVEINYEGEGEPVFSRTLVSTS